jgi:hypothetical protein
MTTVVIMTYPRRCRHFLTRAKATTTDASFTTSTSLTSPSGPPSTDLAAIAGGPGLDIDVLRARYIEELRPKLGRPEREDLTLKLWIEIIEETRQRRQG